MAKSLPLAGELYLGGSSAPLRVQEIIVYSPASTADCTDKDSDDLAITQPEDTSATYTPQLLHLFQVPAGTYVHEMGVSTMKSWGADSNAVDISFGDTTEDSGWISETDFSAAATDAGLLKNGASAAYAKGKYYTAATYIDMKFNAVSSASGQTGALRCVLIYSNPK